MNNTRQVVLVTGASSGIGKAIARTLLTDGYTVYAAARRVEQMADLAALGAILLKVDVTQATDVEAALAQIGREHGGVDVLVNNAGLGLYGAVEDVPLDDARYLFEVNLFAVARLTQMVLPHMRERRAGKIVNISSMGGKIYLPLGAWYHASKHALEGWSDCLRYELAPFNIDVIIVEPGLIATDFNAVGVAPVLAHSGAGPYRALAEAMARNSADDSNYSPPTIVAEAVARALRARRPRTRYVVGRMARPLIFARRWLGDRLYDWVVRRSIT